MARYIDADALNARLQDFAKWCRDGRKQGVAFVLDGVLPDITTADVVPKSEVEALLKENDRWMTEYAGFRAGVKQIVETAKTEVAREIFDEIFKAADYFKERKGIPAFALSFWEYIAELKKKYTEGKI